MLELIKVEVEILFVISQSNLEDCVKRLEVYYRSVFFYSKITLC